MTITWTRRLVLVLLLALPGPVLAEPLPAHADRVADYDIRVRLDPEAKRLFGEERVVWRNPSADQVGDLWFHLYLNAFRNSRSTFFQESGGRPRGGRTGPDAWGGIDITSIRLADGIDLAGGMTFEQPDDDNAHDRTVVRVVLPEPVGPGESVAVDVVFEARLPGTFVRTGWAGDYFLVGQWFPKLGVYEPAGMRGRTTGGWNCHQFHAPSEFYADFGTYGVEITLPERFVVGATGRRMEVRESGDGSVTHVYAQADVHDFAWTASPDFLETRSTFVADEEVSDDELQEASTRLGRSVDQVRLTDVEIVVLLQPAHAPQAQRHVEAAKAGLKWFGLWYGRYPYDTFTIVDPAPGGGGSSGMEYPTFVTAGTLFLLNHWPFDQILWPEEMVLHELAHQFWQGMVATNEFEEPWLDEGFATWSAVNGTRRAYGDKGGARVFGMRLGRLEAARMTNTADRDFAPIRGPAWNVSRDYRFDIYNRAALTLWTLERLIGEEAMARVMRTYHERWRFRHPSSEDFYAVASQVSGRDLSDFFHQTVESPGHLDYAVTSVRSARRPGPGGILDDGAAATGSYFEPGGGAEISAEPGPWRSVVHVRRLGETVLPVDVELQFEEGPAQRRWWDGRDRQVSFVVEGPHRLRAAVVDPDDVLLLDVNRLNNALRVEPDEGAADIWGARILFWLQGLLVLVGL